MILEAFCRATGSGIGEVDVAVGSELECFVAEQAPRNQKPGYGQLPPTAGYMIANGDDDPFEGPWSKWISGDPERRTAVVIGPDLAARLSQEAIIAAAHEHPECSIREE
jgi:hypothetical protein